MPGIYRPRHPERTVLYRVFFHHFERFVAEYESRFERDYGFFRPIIQEVVEKYLVLCLIHSFTMVVGYFNCKDGTDTAH